MTITKETFKTAFRKRLREKFAIEIEESSQSEQLETLASLVEIYYSDAWTDTRKHYLHDKKKQVFYFSIEYLPGKMLKSNLLNLGILDVVKESCQELELDFSAICDAEIDMALGNGGLGRLASCFMDSIASCGLPGNGNGIRYDYGLFKQKFVDGYQVELPDEWLKGGNIWEVRKESKSVNIQFGGTVYLEKTANGQLKPVYENSSIVRAVPYDTGMVGYHNDVVNTLRLWSVEIPLSEEYRYQSIEQRRKLEDITAVLYPDDSSDQGKEVRLTQEYFFVSAGIQSIIRYHKKINITMEQLPEYVAIHINDTHPALCVAELMRLLLDEEELSWDKAWDITTKVMSYTNHTIMAEALEKWSIAMIQRLLPRLYQIILEIDRRFVADMSYLVDPKLIERTRPISDGYVHMAHLAIIGSHSTNGVAKIHTNILKTTVLKDFYQLYPERFNNKTNGIAQRRWSQLANEPLSALLDQTIGSTWRQAPKDIHLLMNFQDDPTVLEALADVKLANKKRLAAYILKTTGIVVSPTALFDVQIKRLHAYKRQLLNLLNILTLYLEIKDNPEITIVPRVFIFGAKAAPSYSYAKSIIKCINETANMINHDESIRGLIKVVFLENYNVSLAELIIPGAEVSEQLSLATKEASGTSNMKLMLNGAVTVATLDGANIEICDAVGEENIFIFGLKEEEVYQHYDRHDYSAVNLYESNPVLQKVINAFIDGTIPNITREGQEIVDSLLKYNDDYFVLEDYADYVDTQKRVAEAYSDSYRWQKMSLINIANSGGFSADYTVQHYANDIWQIES